VLWNNIPAKVLEILSGDGNSITPAGMRGLLSASGRCVEAREGEVEVGMECSCILRSAEIFGKTKD
jgi:hypothetical protein